MADYDYLEHLACYWDYKKKKAVHRNCKKDEN